MISERQLAGSFSSFWNELTPLLPKYVRYVNKNYVRYGPPISVVGESSKRGLVNETAFRIAKLAAGDGALSSRKKPSSLHVQHGVSEAFAIIQRLEENVMPLTEEDINEARLIADSVGEFVSHEDIDLKKSQFCPRFSGCGFVNDCEGDLLTENILVEFKAGARNFLGTDFKQLLIYCALAQSSGSKPPVSICVANPRTKAYFCTTLEDFCDQVCRYPAEEVLYRISLFMQGFMNSK